MSNKYIEQLVKMAEEAPSPNIPGYVIAPAVGGAALGGFVGHEVSRALGDRKLLEIQKEIVRTDNPKISKYWARDYDLTKAMREGAPRKWGKRGAAAGALTLGGLGAAEYLYTKNRLQKTAEERSEKPGPVEKVIGTALYGVPASYLGYHGAKSFGESRITSSKKDLEVMKEVDDVVRGKGMYFNLSPRR
jgi:hypothetical protein